MVDKQYKRSIIKLSTQKHAGAGAKGVHTMTRTTATKDEEMKALRKIRDIVEGLGSDSYLAISTEGFWGMAETNILDDTGNSVAQYRKCWEQASTENRDLAKQLDIMTEKFQEAQEIIEANKKAQLEMHKSLKDEVYSLETQLVEAHALKEKTMDTLNGIIDGLDVKLGDTMKELEELRASKDLEIMKLKAEVYDLKKGGN